MARRYSAEQWAQWVAEQHESALGVRDFCDWIGASQSAYYLCRRKLAVTPSQEPRTIKKPFSGSASHAKQSDVRSLFVPLTLVGSPVIEVDLPCGAVVRVPCEESSLRRVLGILLEAESTVLRGSGQDPRLPCMKRNQLPTSIEELRTMLLEQHRQMQTMLAEKEALRQEAEQAKREVVIAKQQTIELTSTVTKQKKELERSERTIKELLQALKGKKRERLDPNQLLLFELGELEQLIEDAARTEETQPDQNAATKPAARKKKKHGRRIIPDNLPTEEIVQELPEAERLCPIDGTPMPVIRYEISGQLDYEPSRLPNLLKRSRNVWRLQACWPEWSSENSAIICRAIAWKTSCRAVV